MVKWYLNTSVALALAGLVLTGCPDNGGPVVGSGSASLVTGFNKARGFDGIVHSARLAQDGSGDLYVRGNFTAYNSTGVNRLVRLNADGSIDAGFVIGTGPNTHVLSLAPATDGTGDLFVRGVFTTYNSTVVDRLMRLHADGSVS